MRSAGLLSSSPLVGRDRELAAVRSLVAAHPLVTLTGPGGIGKTRLALAALDAVADEFPDGVTLCPLVPVTDPAAVRTTVATRLGLLLTEEDSLGAALGGRRTLVVLDNCEHLLSAVRDVAEELLAAGPGVRVLSTSRESLAVPGERLFPVGPLEVVDGSPGDVTGTPAVRLFTDRAQAVLPDFRVDESNVGAVVELCRRLDGLPLALELAASRVRSMTPAEMLDRLSRGAHLEAPAKWVTPDRHRSLHSVVDWSYRLLDQRSRQVFERMSVMAGGCSLEAVEVLCSDGDVRPDDVLDVLDGLVDRSLVFTARRDGRTRYLVLQTLRSYAAERLAARGETVLAAGKHADFFASVCDSVWHRLHATLSEKELAWLGADLPNIDRAVQHCLAHDDGPARAYRLVAGLWPLAFGPDAPTVVALAAGVLAAWPPDVSDHPLGPDVAGVAAGASLALDDAEAARQHAELAIAAGSPGTVPPMWGRRVLGELLAWYEGKPAEGLDMLERALADARSTDRRSCVRDVEHLRLLVLPELGRYDEALDLARSLAREHGEAFEGRYARMAEVCLVARDDVAAADALVQALLASGDGAAGEDATALPRMLLDLTRGTVAALRGRHGEAALAFAAALDVSLRRGVRRFWASQIGSVLPLLARHSPAVARQLWGAVLAAGRRCIHLETPGLAAAVASLGPVAPRPLSAQGALELARAELTRLVPSDERPVVPAPRSPTVQRTGAPGDGSGAELVRGAGVWTVTWRGRRSHLPDLKGLADLAVLLRSPGVEVHVLDLYVPTGEGRSGQEDVGGSAGGLGEVVDAPAREAYRRRIRELQEDVETAEAMGDPSRAERAGTELDALVTHLAGAYGLGGRPRHTGDPAERARSAVAWRIRSVVRRIAAVDPVLGRHLSASVHTGTWCRYAPPEPVRWTVTTS